MLLEALLCHAEEGFVSTGIDVCDSLIGWCVLAECLSWECTDATSVMWNNCCCFSSVLGQK